MILIESVRISIKIKESYERLKLNNKTIDLLSVDEQHANYLRELCKRKENIYCSYILHNSLYLIVNVFSLKYSIATFATSVITLDDAAAWKATVLSVLTMTMLIINMCVKPKQHANQYLVAWRRYEKHAQYMLQLDYKNLKSNELHNIKNSSIKTKANIENSFKYDKNDD